MDFDEINKILDIVREHDLSEFELEREGFKIRIKKGNVDHASGHFAGQMVPAVLHHPGPAPAASMQASGPEAVPSAASSAAAAAAAAAAEEVDLGIVKSPIVGTFFRSSEPGG